MTKILISNISSIFFNFLLLAAIILGIQNSNEREKIRFIKYESFQMPISLIVGTSFVSGSLFANFFLTILKIDRKHKN
mgnify:CR=1 FL=1|tara:strand:+ start:154 stop:387 length:234 start_codon:yes stop_codon:yes gene_type:complete